MTTTAASAQPNKLENAFHVALGLSIIAGVICGAFYFFADSINLPSLKSLLYSPSGTARAATKEAVEKRLVSPGSAEFTSRVVAWTADEKFFVVYVRVDSQNGFGAVIRNHALALVMVGENVRNGSEILHLELTKDPPLVSMRNTLTETIGTDWELES